MDRLSTAASSAHTRGLERFLSRFHRISRRSDRPTRPLARLAQLPSTGFQGRLVSVNPKNAELFGQRCYGDLEALPEVPDLVMIGLSAERTLEAVNVCERIGVAAAILCSAGWSEAGEDGRARAGELEKIIRRGRIRILGPNCLGTGNPAIGMSLGYNSSIDSMSIARGRIGSSPRGRMMGGCC